MDDQRVNEAHSGRREFDNIIDRSLGDVLQRFPSKKSLMAGDHQFGSVSKREKTSSGMTWSERSSKDNSVSSS